MTEDAPRSDAVQAVFDALISMDPAKARQLASLSVTPAERAQAEHLALTAMLATEDYRDRQAEVWETLVTRQWSTPGGPSWTQLFDDLTPERAERLRELYNALPDGARAEFDKRYGRP